MSEKTTNENEFGNGDNGKENNGLPKASPSGAVCWRCSKSIEALDAFCRFCGSGQGTNLPWYYEPFWIGVLTLFALGPFSLTLIWKTPRLGPRGRWAATALVLLFTFWMVRSTYDLYRQMKAYLAIPV